MQEHNIILRQLGLQPYTPISQAMYTFTSQRTKNTSDELWLVQHYPIFTQGKTGKIQHTLAAEDIPLIQSDRGGQITYHGPGQQVMYILMDLKRNNFVVRQLVEAIENTVIKTLDKFGIQGHTKIHAPGVYVGIQKICSLGLSIHKGCSYHGLALNISMDLTPFSHIHPCGCIGMQMTQISALNRNVKLEEVQEVLIDQFTQAIGYKSIELSHWNMQDYN
ncbi:lipoyl(octanoyl) transferase LipB [Candidatus Profftia tarda]|uniref:Octanoyltransferase n=1 Tax=Candidatus Profftia tarda TaxID=1177216 RepID=A0A8E4H4A6_9ENTR|nr:lipoyl(octanoyl) transferase LipB [Candidatus Profftia tarda]CAD6507099.1 Octanoyltransferase [Candidatus Profftia tarda]